MTPQGKTKGVLPSPLYAPPAEPPTVANTVVWVHTWWKRDGVRDACLRSVEASDVGINYLVERQPTGAQRGLFFVQTLERLSAEHSDKLWMLRLEDDTVVNRHLFHNLARWDAYDHPLFGAGWLSYPQSRKRVMYQTIPWMAHSGGVLLPMRSVSAVLKYATNLPEARRACYDICMSRAIWWTGRRIFFHHPALVAMDFNIPSSIGSQFTKKDKAQDFDGEYLALGAGRI